MKLVRVQEEFIRFVRGLRRHSGVILVHGGGSKVTRVMKGMNIAARFVAGRRITDSRAISVVERVLSGEVNKELVGFFLAHSLPAVGISGRDGGFILGRRLPGLGHVGIPVSIDGRLMRALLRERFMPVVSSIGADSRGRPLNINADEVASAIACALKAEKLIYLTDVNGVLDSYQKRIPVIHLGQIQKLIRTKVVRGGMVPKLKSCALALKKGVKEVRILMGGHLSEGSKIIKR